MRRYLLIFGIPPLFIMGFATLLSFIFQPIDGDLTRIGAYAERDFGWSAPQPVVDTFAGEPATGSPDILILGDSFSGENIWQSVLSAEQRKKIQTFPFQPGCIGKWVAQAAMQKSASTIIIETVEREFVSRFRDLGSCPAALAGPIQFVTSKTLAERPRGWPNMPVYYTAKVAYHTLEMEMVGNGKISAAAINAPVVNAPIDAQCANFSNRVSNRFLYFADDEAKRVWRKEEVSQAVSNLLRLQQTVVDRNKQFLFALVPDKLSVYQDCMSPEQRPTMTLNAFSMLIGANVNMPDLEAVFRANRSRVRDLYRPNNTHLSTAGYKLMAHTIAGLLAAKP